MLVIAFVFLVYALTVNQARFSIIRSITKIEHDKKNNKKQISIQTNIVIFLYIGQSNITECTTNTDIFRILKIKTNKESTI